MSGRIDETRPPSSMRRCAVHAAETHVIIFIAYWGSGPFLLESCEGQRYLPALVECDAAVMGYRFLTEPLLDFGKTWTGAFVRRDQQSSLRLEFDAAITAVWIWMEPLLDELAEGTLLFLPPPRPPL